MVTTTVYRQSIATQYGPGFYGQRTACGRRLTKTTIGVANRTLKCGSPVAILYRGKTLIVPVIDRGPYANHADWDLTQATGQALGISGTATIGAVSLPQPPSRP
jgi:rare lipoprotein A